MKTEFVFLNCIRLLLHGNMEAAKKAAEFYGLDLNDEIQEMEKHKVPTIQQRKKKTFCWVKLDDSHFLKLTCHNFSSS